MAAFQRVLISDVALILRHEVEDANAHGGEDKRNSKTDEAKQKNI